MWSNLSNTESDPKSEDIKQKSSTIHYMYRKIPKKIRVILTPIINTILHIPVSLMRTMLHPFTHKKTQKQAIQDAFVKINNFSQPDIKFSS
ncbi:MAG: hypothetical protein Ta2A_17720 [Treponemataceae bacterium]|nr:MAG: hypothetical protein Ta2A_17720 [Treponemataceae bacterium]